MPCVFCGSSPVTNEHVFPRWLNRYLPSDRRQQLEQARYGEDGFDFERPSIGLDFRVRKVCTACNSGWMARLEDESIPILDPLIRGLELQIVTRRQQRAIAVWATKTAMMCDLTQAQPLLRVDQRRRMRTHRAIPGSTRVWLGACRELNPIVINQTVRIDMTNLDSPSTPFPDGFYAPIKIGHLCLYVYFAQTDVVVRHLPIYHLGLARIWPRRGGDIAWPPPGMPTDGREFEVFADAFQRELLVYSRDLAAQHGLGES